MRSRRLGLAARAGLLVLLGGCALSEALPTSPYPGRIYGTWAVSPEYCANGWWRFTKGRVETAGETSCDVRDIFTSLSDTPTASYAMSCSAEGLDSEPSWSLTLNKDDSLDIDRHEGGGPIRLIRCGPPSGGHLAPQ